MAWQGLKLNLRVAQKQILTPGLVQMVSVLALNRLELREMIAKLFDSTEKLLANRLGLRYTNAFSAKLHGIQSIADLDLSVAVAGSPVKSNINVNFNSSAFEQTNAAVRIASPEFFVAQSGLDATVLADIDIFTREGFEATAKNPIIEWLELAHNAKNEEFFCLLTDETISELEEK